MICRELHRMRIRDCPHTNSGRRRYCRLLAEASERAEYDPQRMRGPIFHLRTRSFLASSRSRSRAA